MKKTSTQNFVEIFGYINCHSLLSPKPIKNPQQFYQMQLWEDLQLIRKLQLNWNHTGNQKTSHIARSDQQAY